MTGNYTVDVRHNGCARLRLLDLSAAARNSDDPNARAGQHIQRSPFEITLTPKKEGGTSRSPEDDIVRLPPLPDTQVALLLLSLFLSLSLSCM